MKIQLDKRDFAKEEVEFLGYIVGEKGLKTNPNKVEAIVKILHPKILRSFVRSLAWQAIIEDSFEILPRSLSRLQRFYAVISKNASRKQSITQDKEVLDAVNKIKTNIISRDIVLSHPNFEKDFELTVRVRLRYRRRVVTR